MRVGVWRGEGCSRAAAGWRRCLCTPASVGGWALRCLGRLSCCTARSRKHQSPPLPPQGQSICFGHPRALSARARRGACDPRRPRPAGAAGGCAGRGGLAGSNGWRRCRRARGQGRPPPLQLAAAAAAGAARSGAGCDSRGQGALRPTPPPLGPVPRQPRPSAAHRAAVPHPCAQAGRGRRALFARCGAVCRRQLPSRVGAGGPAGVCG